MAWGEGGILSSITAAVGEGEEVYGKISPDGNQMFHVRNATTQVERRYTYDSDGSIEFDVDALQTGWNVKGRMDAVKREVTAIGSQNQVPVFSTTVALK